MKKHLMMTVAASVSMLATSLFAAENLMLKASKVSAAPYNDKAPALFDDKPESIWLSYTGENSKGTVTVLFDEAVSFQAIAVWGANLVSGNIETTTDGSSWSVLGDFVANNATGFLSFLSKDPIQTKGLKFTFNGPAEKKAVTVRDMKIYELDIVPNLATFSKITETNSTGMNWRYPATFLIDGNADTKCSHYSGYKGSSIELDLGEEKPISSIQLKSMRDFKSVNVSTSKDGKTWTKIENTSGSKSTQEPLEFVEQNARYIKMDLDGNGVASEIIVK